MRLAAWQCGGGDPFRDNKPWDEDGLIPYRNNAMLDGMIG